MSDVEQAANQAALDRMRADCLAEIEKARKTLDEAGSTLRAATARLRALTEQAKRHGLDAHG